MSHYSLESLEDVAGLLEFLFETVESSDPPVYTDWRDGQLIIWEQKDRKFSISFEEYIDEDGEDFLIYKDLIDE